MIKGVRTDTEGDPMALHRPTATVAAEGLRSMSAPGPEFSEEGRQQGAGDYGYSLSAIYIIHNLSNVNWLPSGKVLLALGGIKPTLLISLLGQI